MGKAAIDPGTEMAAAALAARLPPIVSKLRRRMRERGGRDDLTPSQVAVLHRLESEGPAAVSSLARGEGMRPQSMSTIVASLQEAGLVSGSPDPRDGRQTLMCLTKQCETWMRKGRAARRDWLTTTIQSRLSAAEQKRLAAALELLSRLSED